MNVAYGILVVSLPILVHDQLRTVPAVLGSTWAAYAVGMMVGSSGYHILRLPVRKSIMVGMVLAWGSVLLLSGLVISTWSLIAGLGIAGVVFGPYPPIARTLVQAVVPPEDRGRIFSVRAAVLGLGTPLGGMVAGFANGQVAPATVLIATGAFVIVTGGILGAFARRLILTHPVVKAS